MMRLRAWWEYLRGTYWAVPSAMAMAAVVLSFGMIQLDEAVTAALLDRLSWVYTGGPEGARAVLSTIAGSMITVAGVTFSITIVALTLASQQFGPRLLRNFLRDLGNQIVLGTFVSTFLYCLLVLRTIRGTDDSEFVPHLAVTLGVVLAMLSLGVLIFFIHHVATSIQASRIIAKVASDLEVAANHLFPDRLGQADTDVTEDAGPAAFVSAGAGDSRTVRATMAGYVQAIDGERLMAVAREQDVSLRLHVKPGAFVRNGTVLMTVCASTFRDKWTDGPFRSVVIVGAERTGTQDIEFFINQLVELAVRALSPGINDPATARSCIDRLEQALCNLASRRFPSPIREDAEHTPRVFACSVTFATLIDSAFSEIGRYGQSSVSVTGRLLEAIRNISACVTRDVDRRPLAAQAAAIVERSRRAEMATCDRDRIEERYEKARTALYDAKEPSRQGSGALRSTPP
ncbi:MAG TPA: DUF2254 domain-containing protein [Thermoanaerobaculia bacterium]|nr:DUF2254 domain-containing protein [Thermoanaerobaculia bacterium]